MDLTRILNEVRDSAPEQLKRNRAILRDLMAATQAIKNDITASGLLDFLNKGTPPTSEKIEDKDVGIIIFDTETTGLKTQPVKRKSKRAPKGTKPRRQIRNQVYELAATLYDNNFKVRDTLHLKMSPEGLNWANSPDKLLGSAARINPDVMDNLEELEKAYLDNKEGFKFDFRGFSSDIDKILGTRSDKRLAYKLKDAFEIKNLMRMTKYEKEEFETIEPNPSTGEMGDKYNVEWVDRESEIMDRFIDFIRLHKRNPKYKDGVYVVAQNLPFDEGMVRGERRENIQNDIKYMIKKANNKPRRGLMAPTDRIRKKARALKAKMGEAFYREGGEDHTFDTKDIFKQIVQSDGRLEKFERIFQHVKEEIGFHSSLINKIFNINPLNRYGKRSISLGKLSFPKTNRAWHTATNDVFVTKDTALAYASLSRLINEFIKIAENPGYQSKYVTGEALVNAIREVGFTGQKYREITGS